MTKEPKMMSSFLVRIGYLANNVHKKIPAATRQGHLA